MSHPTARARLVGNIANEGGTAMMRTTTRSSLAVVAAAVAIGLVGWAVTQLLGVDLTLKDGAPMSEVGPVDVLLASLVAGLAAWGVYALLARRGRAGWWPYVASTALAISITGPSYQADGIAAVALICLDIAVGVVLISGFTRFVPRPDQPTARAVDHPQYHA
jgi:FtsH-binding integral membrane protein